MDFMEVTAVKQTQLEGQGCSGELFLIRAKGKYPQVWWLYHLCSCPGSGKAARARANIMHVNNALLRHSLGGRTGMQLWKTQHYGDEGWWACSGHVTAGRGSAWETGCVLWPGQLNKCPIRSILHGLCHPTLFTATICYMEAAASSTVTLRGAHSRCAPARWPGPSRGVAPW